MGTVGCGELVGPLGDVGCVCCVFFVGSSSVVGFVCSPPCPVICDLRSGATSAAFAPVYIFFAIFANTLIGA